MVENTTGRLLVGTPAIRDGIFDQAVVFMLHHDEMGAIGVVVSDPTELEIDELLPRWSELCVEPAVVFSGGPVEPNGFIGVARRRDGADATFANPIGDGQLATVDLEADPAIAAASIDRLRIFRGYSGWAPGQLDAELQRGAWFPLEAEAGDLWTDQPGDLYERVLRRQRGELRWFANAPIDPRVN